MSTTLELGIGLHHVEHVGHGALAVAAVVVEELDEVDVAFGIADDDVALGVEQRLRIVLDRDLMLLGFGHGLPLFELGDRLLQHLRVLQEILPDDALDLGALCVGHALRMAERCAERQEQGARKGKALRSVACDCPLTVIAGARRGGWAA